MLMRLAQALILSATIFTVFLPQQSWAQAGNSGAGESPLQVRNAMGTILLSGLVGGIFGLSTLSFYDRPQDNIRNIFFGAAAGMIVATLTMTFDVATMPVDKAAGGDVTLSPILDPETPGLFLSYKF